MNKLEELESVFKRVNELTGKYPNLDLEELRELRSLSRGLTAECSDIIYEWANDM